ncbi:MAG: NAD(P)H-dependent oxidoreductase subunit E [Formosimonas sp.]
MANPHHNAVVAALQLHQNEQGALLPVLHQIQNALGFVPESVVPHIADALNLSSAQVHGVLSFYHFFRTQPVQKPLLQICVAEACQARGANTLMSDCQQLSQLEVEPIYCLGQCATGPALLLDGQLKARMNLSKLTACLEAQA